MKIILPCVLWGLAGCSGSQFGAGNPISGTKSKKNKESTPAGPTDTLQEGTDRPDGVAVPGDDVVNDPAAEDPSKNIYVVNGSTCIKPFTLPSAVESLKVKYNWVAEGPVADFNQVMSTPVISLVEGMDAPLIVVSAFKGTSYLEGGYIYGIHGKDGKQKFVADKAARAMAPSSPAIAKIKLKTRIYYFGLDSYLYALSTSGAVLWKSNQLAAEPGLLMVQGGPQVVDLRNGKGPVVLAPKGAFDPLTGERRFELKDARDFPVIAADTDLQGSLEIVTSESILNADGSSKCAFGEKLTSIAAAQLQSDHSYQTIVGVRAYENRGKFAGYRGDTCARVFESGFENVELNKISGGPVNIGPLFGPGTLGISFAGKNNYIGLLNSGLRWTANTDDDSSQTGGSLFDLNGDGRVEVVYNDHDNLYVLDGNSGRTIYQTANSSGTLFEYPIIADADNDGKGDIIVGANNAQPYASGPRTGVVVFQSQANDFLPARPIWHQHGFNPLLIADDGSIEAERLPAFEQKSFNVGYRNNIGFSKNLSACP